MNNIVKYEFENDLIRLVDNKQPKGASSSPFIDIFLNKDVLYCDTCKSKNCIHIQESWKMPNIKKELKKKNIKQPSSTIVTS